MVEDFTTEELYISSIVRKIVFILFIELAKISILEMDL